ncbi:MAG: AAA family ATPase [Spirochaetes bacterium]|jgi:CO dehydrogenase maturation factor|nr:AAA family ATPase [Spirochaetota bacterium]
MCSTDKRKTKIIALCGKGGVGKTSIAAAVTKILISDPRSRVLAIDADPAVGLASALNITVRSTVDDVRNLLINKIENRDSGDRKQVISLLDYEITNALEERGNLAFLAIGRPEKEGCYCQVNDILKDVIKDLSRNFDYVVIDGEAGIEQINRRVMESVTHLMLVSDQSAKGIGVIATLRKVAAEAVHYERIGYIINRIRDEIELGKMQLPSDVEFLGFVPEEETIRNSDIEGKSLLNLSDCPALDSIRKCLDKMGIFHHEIPDTKCGCC